MGWHRPLTQALGSRKKQENHEDEASLGCMVLRQPGNRMSQNYDDGDDGDVDDNDDEYLIYTWEVARE